MPISIYEHYGKLFENYIECKGDKLCVLGSEYNVVNIPGFINNESVEYNAFTEIEFRNLDDETSLKLNIGQILNLDNNSNKNTSNTVIEQLNHLTRSHSELVSKLYRLDRLIVNKPIDDETDLTIRIVGKRCHLLSYVTKSSTVIFSHGFSRIELPFSFIEGSDLEDQIDTILSKCSNKGSV